MPIDPPELWDAPTRALLDARTRAVASPATPLARGARPEALGLRIAGERYAIAAHAIRGVAALKRLTALPHALTGSRLAGNAADPAAAAARRPAGTVPAHEVSASPLAACVDTCPSAATRKTDAAHGVAVPTNTIWAVVPAGTGVPASTGTTGAAANQARSDGPVGAGRRSISTDATTG